MNDLIFLITLYLFSCRNEIISIFFYVISILKLPVIIIIIYLIIILENRSIQQPRINQRTNNIVLSNLSIEPSIIILDESGNFQGITRKYNRIQNRIRPAPLT